MNTTKKKQYQFPLIERIKLDNEISLILESTPPTGPDEGISDAKELNCFDPFKQIT